MTAKKKLEKISDWLEELMTDLTFDDGSKVFKRVLQGTDKSKLKSFGDGAICTVYTTGASEFDETLSRHNITRNINSVIAFILKGESETIYKKSTKIMDLLLDKYEFEHKTYGVLETPERVVRDTDIIRADLTEGLINNKISTIGVIELRHHVYK